MQPILSSDVYFSASAHTINDASVWVALVWLWLLVIETMNLSIGMGSGSVSHLSWSAPT